jgi:hypothetical protein
MVSKLLSVRRVVNLFFDAAHFYMRSPDSNGYSAGILHARLRMPLEPAGDAWIAGRNGAIS